jgi:hypothetical protein
MGDANSDKPPLWHNLAFLNRFSMKSEATLDEKTKLSHQINLIKEENADLTQELSKV